MDGRQPNAEAPHAVPGDRHDPGALGASPYLAGVLTLAGLALSVCMGLLSDGTHQDDDLTHLQIARWSWTHPVYLLDNWGRPGFTALYAPAARLGWDAARIFSGLLTALTAWLAYLIARRQGVRLAALTPLLLWLQPLTFTLSYTTLTETPLAFYVTLAMWLYLRGSFALSAAVVSLATVTRQEAAIFPALWALAMIWRRRPVWEWLWVAWAPLVHNVCSAAAGGTPPWMVFFDTKSQASHGTGTWLSIWTRWPVAAGLGPLLLACIGTPAAWRLRGGALWIGSGLAYFAIHTLVFRLGLFATGACFRYLVPVGPMIAVAACVTLSRALAPTARSQQPSELGRGPLWLAAAAVALLWIGAEAEALKFADFIAAYGLEPTVPLMRVAAGVLALLATTALVLSWMPQRAARVAAVRLFPVAMLLVAVAQPLIVAQLPVPAGHCGPLPLSRRHAAQREAVEWLRAGGWADRPLVAASPWIDEFAGRVPAPGGPTVRERVESMQPGDILVWECREMPSPHCRYALDDLLDRDDFALLWQSGGSMWDAVDCALFEKREPGAAHPDPAQGAAAVRKRANAAGG